MKKKTFTAKVNSFLYNHIWLKHILEYGVTFILTLVSAFLFTCAINIFLSPSNDDIISLVSGGISGCAQIIVLIFQISGLESFQTYSSIIYGIAYALLNIPLAIIAFKGISVRFAIFTVLNFGAVALFTSFFNTQNYEFLYQVAKFVNDEGGIAARALFAGLLAGLGSALAFKLETSTGGIDVISYYLSIRKSTTAGKYGVIINACIIIIYSLLNGIGGEGTAEFSSWVIAISSILFTVIYLFTTMLVIDFINVRNKKVQLQIVTQNEQLHTYLLANVPHGATIVKGKGAFSEDERNIIYMVISSVETRQVISLIKSIDPNSFVSVTSLQQVYGRFFIRPVK